MEAILSPRSRKNHNATQRKTPTNMTITQQINLKRWYGLKFDIAPLIYVHRRCFSFFLVAEMIIVITV
jgi:hypothetical protein